MMWDTWRIMSGSQCAMCQVESKVNIKLKWDPCGHVTSLDWVKIQIRWISG